VLRPKGLDGEEKKGKGVGDKGKEDVTVGKKPAVGMASAQKKEN